MRRTGRGEITKISKLFEVYTKRLRPPQGTVVKTFQEVVKDLFKIEIKSEQCAYSVTTKTLTLSVSGPLKTEIRLHKEEILNHLKGRLGEKGAPREIL